MSIKLEHINYIYSEGTAYEKHALKDVNLEIRDGEFVGVIGHTGSGKSTLIQHLNGLLKASSGALYFNGRNVYEEGYPMKELRSQVGLVFQYPEYQLFEADVMTDVCFGPKNQGLSPEECKERAMEALKLVGLKEKYYQSSPFELSGGQKRRAAIAGVLAMRPKVLVLDEPTAGLDPKGRDEILGQIASLHKASGLTVILVSHSMEDIARYADRIIVMDDGRIVMDGKPREIFSRVKELKSHGLDVPQATELAWELKEAGMPLGDGILGRRELVEQIEETVARYGMRKEDGSVKVMSIQWLSRNRKAMDGQPDLIVIDEAHHALAETYRELWKKYPEARKLGMTATPCRLNRKGFTDLFDTLITSWSIVEFIGRGWLSSFDYVSIRANSKEQRLIDSLKKRGADGDYQVKEMNAVLNRETGIRRLYESVRRYAAGKKGIVYAVSIAHARQIAAYYSLHGVKSVAIDSKTPASERGKLVEAFRQGEISVLVNVDIFSEGFDCPDVEFVQLARPTLSLAKYLQQVGRGLRKSDDKESCMLIDNVGLHRIFGLPVRDRDWEAMFEGRMAGNAQPRTRMENNGLSVSCSLSEIANGMKDWKL